MEKAEFLNHTFVNHFNTNQMPIEHADIPIVNPDNSIGGTLCSEEEVYKLLCSLETIKSNGDDDISAIMLKNFQKNGKYPVLLPSQNIEITQIHLTIGQSPCSQY